MATMTDNYDEYDEYYEDEADGPSGLVILIVGLAIVILFCLIVVFAYKRGMAVGADQAGEVPLVTAEAGPVRTERELDLPAGTRPEVEETLSGNAPAEVLTTAENEGDPLDDFENTVSASQQASDSGATTSPAQTQPQTQPQTTQSIESAPVQTTQPETSQPAQTTPQAQTPTRPQSQPAQTTTTQPATSTAPVGGTHVVQVGAFGSDQEANTFYDRLTGRYATLMSGKRPDIQRADLGERGVFHRLRVGPFSSYDAASTWCNQLKAAGQDCLVRAVD